jgi:2',3'-cyclic-nucleotide 2'-phosphodiesterase (5'-nucleotidase family)
MQCIISLVLLFGIVLVVAGDSSLRVDQQPDAPDPLPSRHSPLDWGSINFLHTTDVHVFFLL